MRTCLAIFVVCLCAQGAFAGVAAPDGIRWVSHWDEAVRISRETGRPIMVHFNMNGESACADIARLHFRRKEIIELSHKFVCVLASPDDHADEAIFEGGGLCHRFGNISCTEHRRTEIAARMNLLRESTVVAPQFIFATADLQIILRKSYSLSSRELVALMKKALGNSPGAGDTRETEGEIRRRHLIKEARSDNVARRKAAMETLTTDESTEVELFFVSRLEKTVDDSRRIEVINVMGKSGNTFYASHLARLLGERSSRIRRQVLVSLYRLGVEDGVESLVKAYGRERKAENKALILRVSANCAPDHPGVRKILRKGLLNSNATVRAAAAFSFLEVDPTASEFKKIVGMAYSDQDKEVRACACLAATDAVGRITGSDERGVAALVKRLNLALKRVAGKDRSRPLRGFAAACVARLKTNHEAPRNRIEELYKDHDVFTRPQHDSSSRTSRGRRARRR